MSFGKRGSGNRPTRPAVISGRKTGSFRPAPANTLHARLKANDGEDSETLFEIVSFVTVAAAVLGAVAFAIFYFIPKPLWQAREEAVFYSYKAMAQKQLVTGKSLVSVDREMEKLFRFSPSKLLLIRQPAGGSAYAEARKICLEGKTIPDTLFAPQAFRIYTDVTTYVACMMEEQKQRFCSKSERKRLIRLLKGYSRYRQQVIAAERLIGEFGNIGKMALQRQVDVLTAQNGTNRVDLDMSIGKTVDGRILLRLRQLVEDGLMSASDYSFMGWWLPADYAAAFINARPATAPACG